MMSGSGPRRLFRLRTRKDHVARDVDDELAFHLLMRTEKLVATGMDPEAARREALRHFGDLSGIRAECLTIDQRAERTMKLSRFFEELRQDTAYALRALRRRPGFTLVVLLTLALGIGANTAIFSLVDTLLLRTLPVPRPEPLVTVGDPTDVARIHKGDPITDVFSYPLYRDLRRENHLTTGLLASGRAPGLDIIIPESPSAPVGHSQARFVSANYFAVLGVQPLFGRPFVTTDPMASAGPTTATAAMPDADPVVVLSYGYWQRRFAGDRDVLGRTILINDVSLTVAGVMPAGFSGAIVGRPTELWVPLAMQPLLMPRRSWLRDRNVNWLLLMGRLRPSVTLERARAGFTRLARQSLEAHAPETGKNIDDARQATVQVTPGARGFSAMRADYRTPLLILLAAVALVLLIVCANVANLMLARGTARQREVGVRMALGAGRVRVARQLITESAILAGAGAAVGLLLASGATTLLLRWIAPDASVLPLDVHLDARVLGFTAALALVTALLCGLVPALRAARVQLASTLRANARGLTGGLSGAPGRRFGLGKLLVVLQVGLSLLLLVGTGMLVQSMRNLEHTDTGLARDQLLIADVTPMASGYEDEGYGALARELVQRVRRIPGVRDASVSMNGLFSGGSSGVSIVVPGFTPHTDADLDVSYDAVGPGYFRAIGARLLHGRGIEPRDANGQFVGVVNRSFADFYFPGEEAVGRTVMQGSVEIRIIGVVTNVKGRSLRRTPRRQLYIPLFRFRDTGGWIDPGKLSLEVRADGDPARLTAPVSRAIREVDTTLHRDIDPLGMRMSGSINELRLVSRLISGLGLLALVLAALGLFGIMTYTTVRRTGEFGLRLALGAEPRDVARAVLFETLTLVAFGIVIGVPASWAAARLLEHQLFGVASFDVPSIVLAIVVLALSAALAGYLPARRAARVGPLVALREE